MHFSVHLEETYKKLFKFSFWKAILSVMKKYGWWNIPDKLFQMRSISISHPFPQSQSHFFTVKMPRIRQVRIYSYINLFAFLLLPRRLLLGARFFSKGQTWEGFLEVSFRHWTQNLQRCAFFCSLHNNQNKILGRTGGGLLGRHLWRRHQTHVEATKCTGEGATSKKGEFLGGAHHKPGARTTTVGHKTTTFCFWFHFI